VIALARPFPLGLAARVTAGDWSQDVPERGVPATQERV
jgi:hypothetical protein